MKKNVVFLFFLSLLLGCAKERPFKPVIPNPARLPKAAFQGTFLFLKSLSDVRYPGDRHAALFPGQQLEAGTLVQFLIRETSLDVEAVDPLYAVEKDAEKTRLLARFPIRHVDLLPKQNADGEDTSEQEETETRRPWQQRTYLVWNLAEDRQDPFSEETRSVTPPETIDRDAGTGALYFQLTRQLTDDTRLEESYSFLPFRPSPTYRQRAYDPSVQQRFGFFKSSTYRFDAYGHITQKELKEYLNRWDSARPVFFQLAPGFPSSLAPLVSDVFARWNAALRPAIGHDLLILRPESAANRGDLRANLIVYDEGTNARHGLLGYAPVVANPRTGEIVKADVYLYGGTLKRALQDERTWGKLRPPSPGASLPAPSSAATPFNPGRLVTVDNAFPGGDAVERLRHRWAGELSRNMTRLDETYLALLHDTGSSGEVSDEEMQRRIFIPLLTHELGHVLGLRHNFMGSADARHFEGGARTSSVMDYGFLSSEDPTSPAPYDRAALLFGYGPDTIDREALLKENFFYCTDENILSSTDALCNQSDTGTSVTEAVSNQIQRYFASWEFNNARGDQVFFGDSTEAYLERLQRFLVPIRLAGDYAQAVLGAYGRGQLSSLWTLLRQRIEADPGSKPADLRTIKVSEGIVTTVVDGAIHTGPRLVERQVDLAKVRAVVDDARSARTAAFDALDRVVEQKRPDYDAVDQFYRRLQIRGVLWDKLLALKLIAHNLPDPLVQGTTSSLFTSLGAAQAGELFTQILSNTVIVGTSPSGDKRTDFAAYDIHLREEALRLLTTEIGIAGASPEARSLLTLEKVKAPEPPEITKLRDTMRGLYQTLYRGELADDQRSKWQDQLTSLLDERQRLEGAFVATYPGAALFYKAPVNLTPGGFDTASGRLIRDNINRLEDQQAAARKVRDDLDAALRVEKDPGKRPALQASLDQVSAFLDGLESAMAAETLFLGKIYQAWRNPTR